MQVDYRAKCTCQGTLEITKHLVLAAKEAGATRDLGPGKTISAIKETAK